MKNAYEVRGDVTAIFVKGLHGAVLETLIDTEDLPIADSFPNSWYAHFERKYRRYYVQGVVKRNHNKQYFVLSRMIMNAPPGDEVDHINHDTLDNRKANLRVVTTAQNQQNRLGAQCNNSSSGIRGVSWDEGSQTWRVYVKLNRKHITIGCYDHLSEAEQVAVLARAALMPYSPEARVFKWIRERYGAV